MQLSSHFTLYDLTESMVATQLGYDNTPDADAIDNLRVLCTNVLEPIHEHFNSPFTRLYGYRCVALNNTIGCHHNSQNMHGQAADIKLKNVDNYTLAEYIAKNLNFDRLTLEYYDPNNPYSGWVNVSITRGINRHECRTYTRQHGYCPGLTGTAQVEDKRIEKVA